MPTRRRAREESDELANQAPRTRPRRSGAAPASSDAEGAISSGPEAGSASHESMQPAPRVEGSTSHSQDTPRHTVGHRHWKRIVTEKVIDRGSSNDGATLHSVVGAVLPGIRENRANIATINRQLGEQVRLPVARVTADAAVCPETFQKRLIGWMLTLAWGLRLGRLKAQARFGTLVHTLVNHVNILVTLATDRGMNRGKYAGKIGTREVNSHCCRKWILTLS